AGIFTPVARLRRGVSVAAAQAQLDVLVRRVARQYPETAQDRAVVLTQLQFAMFELSRPMLWLLVAAAALVLAIACANIASLLMARGAARLRELGVRAAIGASRGRLLRQLLTESLVLSSAGAILSVVLGTTVFQWLVRLAPPRAYRLLPDGLEPRAVVFAVAVSAIAGMIFGVIPALRLSKSGVAETQRRDGARVSLGLSGTMVAVEAALGIALLCAAGLMANSLVR